MFLVYLIGYLFFSKIEDILVKRFHRKEVDEKIKDTLFDEIGFSYRETSTGKKFLIIDEYKKNKAIKL